MSSRSPLRGSSLYNSASGSAGYPSVQAVGGFKSTKPATPARKRSADPEGAPEAGAKRGKDERVIDAHIGLGSLSERSLTSHAARDSSIASPQDAPCRALVGCPGASLLDSLALEASRPAPQDAAGGPSGTSAFPEDFLATLRARKEGRTAPAASADIARLLASSNRIIVAPRENPTDAAAQRSRAPAGPPPERRVPCDPSSLPLDLSIHARLTVSIPGPLRPTPADAAGPRWPLHRAAGVLGPRAARLASACGVWSFPGHSMDPTHVLAVEEADAAAAQEAAKERQGQYRRVAGQAEVLAEAQRTSTFMARRRATFGEALASAFELVKQGAVRCVHVLPPPGSAFTGSVAFIAKGQGMPRLTAVVTRSTAHVRGLVAQAGVRFWAPLADRAQREAMAEGTVDGAAVDRTRASLLLAQGSRSCGALAGLLVAAHADVYRGRASSGGVVDVPRVLAAAPFAGAVATAPTVSSRAEGGGMRVEVAGAVPAWVLPALMEELGTAGGARVEGAGGATAAEWADAVAALDGLPGAASRGTCAVVRVVESVDDKGWMATLQE